MQTFASHDHSSSVRCVDVCGNLMASGGADDRIIVYDLKTRQEHCMLTHHNSTVNCLTFTPARTHLISGSADGSISIVRVGNWQLEKLWEKAHKGAAILDIAVHETGKLALSLGADCSLRTWNLVKGRQAYIINLNSKSKDAKSLTNIQWALDGVKFLLYGGKFTEIWSIDSGGIISSIEHKDKVSSCSWLSEEKLVVGYENGHIGIVSIDDSSIKLQDAHSSRVKAISKYENFIVTACSSGEFKVWDVALNQLAKFETGCRLTCLTIIPPTQIKQEEDVEETEADETVSSEDEITNEDNRRGKVVVVIEEEDDDVSESHIKPKKKKKMQKAEKRKSLELTEKVSEKKSKKKKMQKSVNVNESTKTIVPRKIKKL